MHNTAEGNRLQQTRQPGFQVQPAVGNYTPVAVGVRLRIQAGRQGRRGSRDGAGSNPRRSTTGSVLHARHQKAPCCIQPGRIRPFNSQNSIRATTVTNRAQRARSLWEACRTGQPEKQQRTAGCDLGSKLGSPFIWRPGSGGHLSWRAGGGTRLLCGRWPSGCWLG